jgi:hypothetical protein
MTDIKSPADFALDIRKTLDAVPSPADLVKKLGLPTPMDIEEHQHKERVALMEKGVTAATGKMASPVEALMALAPKPPEDLFNLSFLRL